MEGVVFVETSVFTKRVVQLLSDEQLRSLQNHLLEHPDAGDVIAGSGGLRKLRWKTGNRGKRGGVRIIYFHVRTRDQILMLLIYAKNEQDDLSAEQTRVLRGLVEEELK